MSNTELECRLIRSSPFYKAYRVQNHSHIIRLLICFKVIMAPVAYLIAYLWHTVSYSKKVILQYNSLLMCPSPTRSVGLGLGALHHLHICRCHRWLALPENFVTNFFLFEISETFHLGLPPNGSPGKFVYVDLYSGPSYRLSCLLRFLSCFRDSFSGKLWSYILTIQNHLLFPFYSVLLPYINPKTFANHSLRSISVKKDFRKLQKL